MKFFQDTRSIGLIFWIAVALQLFNSVAAIVGAFVDDLVILPEEVTDSRMFCLLLGIGNLLCAIIYAVNAHRVMSKKLTRMTVLRNYVRTVGMSNLVGGISEGLAVYLYTDDPTSGMPLTIITIVIAIIILLIAIVLSSEKKGILKKIVWVVLVIAFLLMAIDALMESDNYWTYAEKVAQLLIAVFMILLITDGDVMKEMGAKS
jgi:hypothetical protein